MEEVEHIYLEEIEVSHYQEDLLVMDRATFPEEADTCREDEDTWIMKNLCWKKCSMSLIQASVRRNSNIRGSINMVPESMTDSREGM